MVGREPGVKRPQRRDRLVEERFHDTYALQRKLPEPTACPDCGAVYTRGRWTWQEKAPPDAQHQRCSACSRIRDKVPAGILILRGDFLMQHRDEILRLVDNKVAEQNTEHPMKRLMSIEDSDTDEITITFTDTHLPRGVGESIANAYEGTLDIQYTEGANIVRAYWNR